MKKIISKVKQFFGLDEYEMQDRYEQQTELDNVPEQLDIKPHVAPKVQPQEAIVTEEQPKTKTFRFPLIQDQDVNQLEQQPERHSMEKKSNVFHDSIEDETLRLPKHLPSNSQVLEVEVSGIRELLEKRGRSNGSSTPVVRMQREERPIRTKRNVTYEETTYLTSNPSRQDVKQPNINSEFVNPMQNKKRFTPTHVPSPVYGFQQPRPLRELMKEERHLDLNIPVVFEAEEVVPTVEGASFKEQMANEPTNEITQNQMLQTAELIKTAETVTESEEVIVEREASQLINSKNETQNEQQQPTASDIQHISELQLQNVTFENSTVHIGQIHVEPALQSQSVSNNISEEIKQTNVSGTASSEGSKLPFNVLMLKTDKEKVQANSFDALKGGVPKTIVEKVEMRRDAQNGLRQADVPLPKELEDDYEGEFATKPEIEEIVSTDTHEQVDENSEKHELDEIEQRLLENYKATQQQVAQQIQAPVAVLTEAYDVQPGFEQLLHRAEEDSMFDEHTATFRLDEELSNEADTSFEDEELVEQTSQASIDIDEVMQMEQQLQSIIETIHPHETFKPIVEVKRYEKPSYHFLVPPEQKKEDDEWMQEQAHYLIESLQSHQIQAQVESIVQGPAVTQFEITVAAGVKVSKVRNLSDDIKLALAAKDIRIEAPIPGKRTIGIEIPNRIARPVRLSEVTESDVFKNSDSPLEAALGLDLNGKPVTLDLRKMPHGLIAGATGSGKSVCINSILVSLLYKADPHELKLMLIDPKMVELAPFNHIPHLVSPVITDVKAATAALKWAVDEMERRYELFMHTGVRDITRYNSQAEKAGQHAQKMPYLLIVIDELADLMMMSPADVEEAIIRIAQKARACGIHLILATQRPSVDVITGLIKSNIPTRIAFAVSSAVDSRTIIDGQGAERLLGRGDMLYLGNGMSAPVRLQGTFVTDDEIEEIIDYVRSQGEPNYLFQHDELLKKAEFVEEQDELFEEVCRFVYEQGTASTSSIQRRYHLGYNRAARLVDMLERNGFVSEQRGSKPREVFITEEDLENLFS